MKHAFNYCRAFKRWERLTSTSIPVPLWWSHLHFNDLPLDEQRWLPFVSGLHMLKGVMQVLGVGGHNLKISLWSASILLLISDLKLPLPEDFPQVAQIQKSLILPAECELTAFFAMLARRDISFFTKVSSVFATPTQDIEQCGGGVLAPTNFLSLVFLF